MRPFPRARRARRCCWRRCALTIPWRTGRRGVWFMADHRPRRGSLVWRGNRPWRMWWPICRSTSMVQLRQRSKFVKFFDLRAARRGQSGVVARRRMIFLADCSNLWKVVFIYFLLLTTMTELTFDRCKNSKKVTGNLPGYLSRKKRLLGRASRTAGPTQVFLIGSDVGMITIPKAIRNLPPPHFGSSPTNFGASTRQEQMLEVFPTSHLVQAIVSKYFHSFTEFRSDLWSSSKFSKD